MKRETQCLWGLLIAACCFMILASASAQTIYPGTSEHSLPQRYALIIGVGRYKTSGPGFFTELKNAEADAKLIVSELQEMGVKPINIYSVISDDRNPLVTKSRIYQAIADLRKQLEELPEVNGRRRAIVFVYFAGHGLGRAKDGENYLIPADFHVDVAEDIPEFGIAMSGLLKRIAGAKPLDIFTIVDACRDIPFKSLATLDKETEKFEASLVNVNDSRMPLAAIGPVTILFSTLKYTKAPDGVGANSPFATALAMHLKSARNPASALRPRYIDDLSRSVQISLARQSPGQIPELRPASPYKLWLYPTKQDFDLEKQIYDNLREDFRLNVDKIRTDPQAICVGLSRDALENTRKGVEEFIAQYGSSYYGDDGLMLASALSTPFCKFLSTPSFDNTFLQPLRFEGIKNANDRSALVDWADMYKSVPLNRAYVITQQALLQDKPAEMNTKVKANLSSGKVVLIDPDTTQYDQWIKVDLPNTAASSGGFIKTTEAAKAVVPFKTNIDFRAANSTAIPAEELARVKDLLARLDTSVLVTIKATYATDDQAIGLARALAASRMINNMTKDSVSGGATIIPEIANASFVPQNQVQLDLEIAPITTSVVAAISRNKPASPFAWAGVAASMPLESTLALPNRTVTPSLYPITGLTETSFRK